MVAALSVGCRMPFIPFGIILIPHLVILLILAHQIKIDLKVHPLLSTAGCIPMVSFGTWIVVGFIIHAHHAVSIR
jgi:hypothetical protein